MPGLDTFTKVMRETMNFDRTNVHLLLLTNGVPQSLFVFGEVLHFPPGPSVNARPSTWLQFSTGTLLCRAQPEQA